jgi:SOS-response transcriptional repressor LexA
MAEIIPEVKDSVKGNVSHVDLVKSEMKARGWNAAKLSRVSGVSTGVLSRYFNDDGISSDNLFAVMHALSLDVPALQPRPIPVISWVQAGQFADAEDHWPVGVSSEGDPVFSYRKVGTHAFGLRVVGDSMAPRYLPGDTIIVDPELKCDNGSPCVVVLNGEAVFKFFRDTADAIILEPMNPRHPDIIIRKDRSVDFRVVGKVVDLIPKMDILTSGVGFTEAISVEVKRDGNIVE